MSSDHLPLRTPPANPEIDSDLEDVSSIASYDSYDDEAELAWRESLQELELLVSLVLVPFVGKWIGRKCAYWMWGRFMTWKHPSMEMVVTSRAAFEAVGAAAAVSAPL